EAPPTEAVLGGLAAMAAGTLLRLWAIQSLGSLWTMRCLAIPGLRPRRVGPYRILDNPEYISRLIDGLGLAVVLGGLLVPLLYLFAMLALHRRTTEIEARQLVELSHPLRRPRPT